MKSYLETAVGELNMPVPSWATTGFNSSDFLKAQKQK